MEKVLVQQNKHWNGQCYDGLLGRVCLGELLKMLALKEIMVLVGVRRCGKTTLFRQLINYLVEDHDPRSILYINLDDPYFDDVIDNPKGLYAIIENAERYTQTKIQYLFLDEIQNIKGWEKFVKSVYDSEVFKKIFVTGSNSQLLHGHYATLLSGRYIYHYIYPLSIKEVLNHHNITDLISLINEKAKVLSLLDSLLIYGGFPEPYLQNDVSLKRNLLISYYDTILLKDCIAVNNIRDVRLIKELSHYLMTNIAANFSYNSLKKLLSSSEHTIKDYIHTLENGFLFEEMRNYAYSLKQQSKGKKKVYSIDNGLISSIAFNLIGNEGKLFENLIYSELKKIGADEMYFYNDTYECDFIIKKSTQALPIQACFKLNEKNRQREIRGLQAAIEKTHAVKGIIITFDQEETISEQVIVTPIWKIFFENKHIDDLF